MGVRWVSDGCQMDVSYRGQAVFKLGLVQPACQKKLASGKGNQIITRKVEEGVPLFEQSDYWVLQFDLAYNEDGQRKNGPFLARISTTGKRPDGIMFWDNGWRRRSSNIDGICSE